jgi:hypothetical protein
MGFEAVGNKQNKIIPAKHANGICFTIFVIQKIITMTINTTIPDGIAERAFKLKRSADLESEVDGTKQLKNDEMIVINDKMRI